METLEIRMLGDFTIQAGACSISDKDNRTKKIWQLMSYMIYQRGKVVPQRKLIELLWGEDSGSSNPENALRITFHRMRQLLDRLWPTAGRELIIHKDNGYLWNDSIPVTLDYEIFEQLCAVDSEDSETVLRSRMQAIELYNGDFLEKQTSQIWIIPIATHYHNLYLLAVQEAAHLLGSKDCHREASDICRKAVLSEP